MPQTNSPTQTAPTRRSIFTGEFWLVVGGFLLIVAAAVWFRSELLAVASAALPAWFAWLRTKLKTAIAKGDAMPLLTEIEKDIAAHWSDPAALVESVLTDAAAQLVPTIKSDDPFWATWQKDGEAWAIRGVEHGVIKWILPKLLGKYLPQLLNAIASKWPATKPEIDLLTAKIKAATTPAAATPAPAAPQVVITSGG